MAAHASASVAPARVAAAAPRVIGKYRILRELGRGSMGCVYEGEHPHLAKRVAIKLLHPHLRVQPVALERFLREGRFAARLEHPHIVGVTDVELEAAEGPHLVMELVDGPSLAAFLLVEHKLNVARATDLLLPVFSAISHAHAAGIVHRDLKPANIIVGGRAAELVPKVTDFGVGKVTESSGESPLTLDGGLVGSLPYMAPEQMHEARAVDARVDQYALAVILYELTTGRCPFAGNSTYELMCAVSAGQYPLAHEVNADIPRPFSDVLRRAMSLQPDDRYPSVDAFARELLPFASSRAWVRWSRELSAEAGARTFDEVPIPLPEALQSFAPPKNAALRARGTAIGLAFLGAVLAAGALGRFTAKPPPPLAEGQKACVSAVAVSPAAPSPTELSAVAPAPSFVPPVPETAPAAPAPTARRSESTPRARPTPAAPIVQKAAREAVRDVARQASTATTSTKDQYGTNRSPILE